MSGSRWAPERLALLPTPLHPAPELGRVLGVSDLWLKRDDLSGFAWGGNKVRTVDALLAEAEHRGTRKLVVCGGPASNLGAIIAVAGAIRGIEVHRVINGDPPEFEPAALAASRLAGAVIAHTGVPDRDSMEPFARELAAELGATVVPRGGAAAVGAASFADAADELLEQVRQWDLEPARIVVPVGSGGTLAGLAAGLGARWRAGLLGVAVSRDPVEQHEDMRILADEVLALTGRPGPSAAFELTDGRGSGFGVVDESERRFAEIVLRGGGLVVDRTYNLKALHRLRSLGREDPEDFARTRGPTIYWFTGGALDTIERVEEKNQRRTNDR